ncbi:hypothetical protein ACVIGB_000422 [Bradyrhizobium sp. USDA 4341]
MASTVSFLGDFIYQADAKVRGGRVARRFDVVGRHEFTIPLLNPNEVDRDAVVIRTDGGKRTMHMTGWDGRLWLPMEAPRLLASEAAVPLDVRRLAAGCVFDPEARHSFLREDPMLLGNRLSVGRLAPHKKFDPEPGTTINEATFAGQFYWTNKVAATRHYEDAARNLIVIGETVYCHTHPPCWAVVAGEDARTFLSVPSYLINDTAEVIPECGVYSMHNLETFGLLNRDLAEAMTGDRPFHGEVIAFDRTYVERDDLAWQIYPRLWFLKAWGHKFFDDLSADGVRSLKVLTDLWRATDFHDLSPLTRNRQDILAHLSQLVDELKCRPMPAVRLSWRDGIVSRFEKVLQASRRPEFANSLPELSPDDAEALATMASI